MLKIRKLQSLGGRYMRCDDPIEELGKSGHDILKDLIRKGDKENALKLVDYLQGEFKWAHDLYCDWAYVDLDYIAKNYGEEELPKFFRHAKSKLDLSTYKNYGKIPQLDLVRMLAEALRAHRSGPKERGNFRVFEEKDRYVMEFDPCGSGGRMRRNGELDDLPPRTGEPFNLGCTSKAYDWSWSKRGVPYYCLHCCIWHEQMPIEKNGIPAMITNYQDDPNAPCGKFFYKKPEDIPEEYYTRIGKKKP